MRDIDSIIICIFPYSDVNFCKFYFVLVVCIWEGMGKVLWKNTLSQMITYYFNYLKYLLIAE